MSTITQPTPGTHETQGVTAGDTMTLANGNTTANGTTIAYNARWQWNLTGAESSANAGSNLQLQAIADDGTTIVATAISVNRSTGAVTLTGGGGQEYFADGTVAAPSAAASSNHGSGLYFTTNAVNVAANGVQAVQFATATTGVNFLKVTPAATAASPSITFTGSDTNVGGLISVKGTGLLALGGTTAANSSLQIPTAASQVNFLSVAGGIATAPVTVTATGTDTNVGLNFFVKGTGTVTVGGATAAAASLAVATAASQVNYISVAGAITSAAPTITATGTDANIGLGVMGTGTGTIWVGGSTLASSSLQVATAALQVNFVSVAGAIATAAPTLTATGTDTNVGLTVAVKGTGAVTLGGTSATTYALSVATVGSQAEGLIVTGAASGANASISAKTNNLLLGIAGAIATTATTGWVMINTCAGTPTGVPVGHAIGNAAMVLDTSGNKLWFYDNGTWKGVGIA